jgi:formylglycine-generating enzyme required for sulfatase activity
LHGNSNDPAGVATGAGAGAANSTTTLPAEPKPFEEISLSTDSSYESAAITPGTTPGEVREMTALKIPFCWCPPGKFVIGSDPNLVGHMLNEVQHEVTLTKGFWLQKTELTQAQFQTLMGINPAFHPGESNPVETISWNAAMEFARRLSALPPEGKSGNVYRLPTEAEWEYACRAGLTSEFCSGDDPAELEKYAWFNVNSKRTTHPVGEKLPNAWGLHDMHGNVSEWCLDWYGDYPTSPVTDPQGPESGESRVLRGGGWFYDPSRARCAFRNAYGPEVTYVGLGCRLVAVPK